MADQPATQPPSSAPGGITVTISKIGDPAGLRAALVKPETKWDLALIATGPSWPTAYRQLETMVDGRGGQFSTVNDAGVNARLDELDKLPVDQQDAQAVLLDQKIMTELAPLVPIFFDQAHFIHEFRQFSGRTPAGSADGRFFQSRRTAAP